jgi:hypothetical protein
MMNASPSPEPRRLGANRGALSVAWVALVCVAYVVTYGAALLDFARGAAERFPLLERLLNWVFRGG